MPTVWLSSNLHFLCLAVALWRPSVRLPAGGTLASLCSVLSAWDGRLQMVLTDSVVFSGSFGRTSLALCSRQAAAGGRRSWSAARGTFPSLFGRIRAARKCGLRRYECISFSPIGRLVTESIFALVISAGSGERWSAEASRVGSNEIKADDREKSARRQPREQHNQNTGENMTNRGLTCC
jgi:hypothetical protein